MRSWDGELKMADEETQKQSEHLLRLGSIASQAESDSSKQSEKKKGQLEAADALLIIYCL